MNFYEFYQLINENTVSQELKKLQKNEVPIMKTLFEEVKKILFAEGLNQLNEEGKRIITNWWLFQILSQWLRFGKLPDIKDNPEFIINKIKKTTRDTALYIYYSFLEANIDNNGNLNPQLASKFNNTLFTLVNLAALDNEYHQNLKNKQKDKPGRIGKIILSFPEGYNWVDLERGYCDVESETMGHCGNRGGIPGDTILSLRDKNNRPHLTFILNNGILGEMKGKNNDKPTPKYHPYIIELLKLPIIKMVKGGGYLPENNFSLSNLSQEQLKDLFKNKPDFEMDFYLDQLSSAIQRKNIPTEILIRFKNSIGRRNYDIATQEKIYGACLSDPEMPENIVFEIIDMYFSDKVGNYKIDYYSVHEAIKKLKSKEYLTSIFNRHYEELKNITRSHNITSIYKSLSDNPNLPEEILRELIGLKSIGLPGGSVDANYDIVSRAAINPNLPVDALIKLIDTKFRKHAARNPNMPAEYLIKLSEDPKTEVRQSVARNKNTPKNILEKLLDDEKKSVRISAGIALGNL